MSRIEELRAIHRPQRSYEWEVSVLGPSIGGFDGLTVHAQTVTVPEVSVEPIEINHKSEKSIYHGRTASPRTMTISFFESDNLSVYKFFRRWMNIVHNQQTGGALERSEIQADILIKQLAEDSTTVTGIHTLRGAFPTNLADISLSYDTSDVQLVEVTFSFQYHDIA